MLAVVGMALGGASLAQELPSAVIPSRPSIDVDATPRRPPPGTSGQTETPKSRFDLLIGASATAGPEYAGSDRSATRVLPLVGLRWGRFRLTSSGSARLMDFAGQANADEAGASADVLRSDRAILRAGLRLSSGRPSSDSDDLRGIPDVRRTLLGRVTAAYAFAPTWRVSSNLVFDTLGRGNGAALTTGIDHRRRLTPDVELLGGVAFTIDNGTYLGSYFGVPLGAQTPARPAYSPGSGLRDAAIGVGLTARLAPGWIGYGSIGYSHLLGPAADSPLTRRAGSPNATLGIAYRWSP